MTSSKQNPEQACQIAAELKDVKMSDAAEARLKEVLSRYPESKSAVMPALYIAQEEMGWLNREAMHWVSNRLSLPLAHVSEVASFYTMYYKSPVGKYHVQVCRTLSCMLCGARALTARLKERLKLKPSEVSEDGMWSYEEVECLGSCGTGAMVQINDVFFENLNVEKLDRLLDQIANEQPDLRYSAVKEELGKGLPKQPRSQVYQAS